MKKIGDIEKIVLVILIAVIIILFWSGQARFNDFRKYHVEIAKQTNGNVSESVRKFISERKRLITVFADRNKELIAKSAESGDLDNLYAKINDNLKEFFPGYFSFTVTDVNGNPYYDDFDGMIGDLCMSDIVNYARKNENFPRVHPHADIYHYDLLTRIKFEGKEFIVFVTFPADELSNYIRSSQAIGHKTMLVLEDEQHLIEVTAEGARNESFREDYRLKNKELTLLLASRKIEGTRWASYDFSESELFTSFRNRIVIESLFVFLIVVIVCAFMIRLYQKELYRRKKAESVKDDFVSIVSHELRTPLTSINGSIKLIEKGIIGNIDDEGKKFLAVASANIDRLSGIVNDILDIKKIESGEFEILREDCSLNNIIQQAVDENKEFAHKLDAEIEYQSPEKEYIIYADRNRMIQVMTNLISNAVKYGAKNDRVIVNTVDKDRYVRINVEDHGNGISLTNKNFIFEKFTQNHSREEEIVKGTGLGLNIVKNIVEKHDGMVSFDSTKGEGTTFYIILPLVRK